MLNIINRTTIVILRKVTIHGVIVLTGRTEDG